MVNFIMTVGLPASGKSTYVKQYYNGYEIISSDSVRKELYGDESIQDAPSYVFEICYKRILASLKEGRSCVFDATNINRKKRINFLKALPKDVEKVCLMFCIPMENCLKANKERDRYVPEYVIKRMWKQFEPPHKAEGFGKIIYVSEGSEEWESLEEMLEQNITCLHNNPHHSLSCGCHCLECERFARMKIANECSDLSYYWKRALTEAARYHDLSKYKVKTFKNYKGIETPGHAHYYGHANASAYDFLCGAAVEWYTMVVADDKIEMSCFLQDISNLISNHMIFYDNSPKVLEKISSLYGEEFFRVLMILNDCDKAAH